MSTALAVILPMRLVVLVLSDVHQQVNIHTLSWKCQHKSKRSLEVVFGVEFEALGSHLDGRQS